MSDEPGGDVRDLPMFPLGSVLFPGAVLPLQVFEPRYRRMIDDVLAGDGRFGVVLIERGSEVGGGDVRFSVGTVAAVGAVEPVADGRLLVAAVGTQRLRVEQWGIDDPYPLARVRLLREQTPAPGGAQARALVIERLGEVFDLWRRLDERVQPPAVALSDDIVAAAFEACVLAPIGPLDAQRLLELDDATARLEHLAAQLADEVALLRFRLGG